MLKHHLLSKDKKNVYRQKKHLKIPIFAPTKTEVVAQLVRASDCGSEGRGFETRLPPQEKEP